MLRWCDEHILSKDENNWVKKRMDYEAKRQGAKENVE